MLRKAHHGYCVMASDKTGGKTLLDSRIVLGDVARVDLGNGSVLLVDFSEENTAAVGAEDGNTVGMVGTIGLLGLLGEIQNALSGGLKLNDRRLLEIKRNNEELNEKQHNLPWADV